ncbi:2Fe-2S iron-sulfur cluster-binding protein [Pricia sp.]|uniref:(2Fe-2S)-binding protein n=1 Tax=Pricia sp. TaxID=2268138 RepID=UPI0035946E84
MAKEKKEKNLTDYLEENLPEGNKGMSRRGFLRGSGLATAGAMVVSNGLFANSADDSLKMQGPDEIPLKLNINGRPIHVLSRPDETLVDVLRDRLELTGTKLVCGRGACSGCTVMVDGKPVCSCLTLAIESEGKEITTIEGIADGTKLHPVQEAFIEEDASMCGYCTPGMVISCVALLNGNPKPSDLEIKKAVRGNLCRCGTYPHVFKAAMTASKNV